MIHENLCSLHNLQVPGKVRECRVFSPLILAVCVTSVRLCVSHTSQELLKTAEFSLVPETCEFPLFPESERASLEEKGNGCRTSLEKGKKFKNPG